MTIGGYFLSSGDCIATFAKNIEDKGGLKLSIFLHEHPEDKDTYLIREVICDVH